MTNTQSRRALVIGCGIGGPVVAMALQRAGIEPIVVEAFERPADDVGSFLNLSTNGIEALQAIDADRAVLDAGFSTPRMRLCPGGVHRDRAAGRLGGGSSRAPLGSRALRTAHRAADAATPEGLGSSRVQTIALMMSSTGMVAKVLA